MSWVLEQHHVEKAAQAIQATSLAQGLRLRDVEARVLAETALKAIGDDIDEHAYSYAQDAIYEVEAGDDL